MGKVLAYTESDRPAPVPARPGSASTSEEDMTAAGLSQRLHLPGLLKVEQASALMGTSRSAAYRAVATGDLPSVRFGCRLYVPTARLLELLGLVPEDR
jgi:excisionase family DNA binding protein